MMHVEVLARKTKQLLEMLSRKKWLSDFYLAGGTALALQYGHRTSVDLDWFIESDLQTKRFMKRLSTIGKVTVVNEEENTLECILDGVKASFITYPYPLLRETVIFSGSIQLAAPLDIALMKLGAVAGRNTRKDFIDLYVFLHRESMTLTKLMALLSKKHPGVKVDVYHYYKALMHFAEADKEPMPRMLEPLDWKVVKRFFAQEVRKLA